MILPSVFSMVLLFVEASVNLTYYKDCVFALTTFLMFIGMLWFNYAYNNIETDDDSLETSHHYSTQIL